MINFYVNFYPINLLKWLVLGGFSPPALWYLRTFSTANDISCLWIGVLLFLYFQSVYHLFVFLAFFLTPAETSSAMLNKSSVSGHFCFVSNLRRKVFSLSPLNMMLAADVIRLKKFLLFYFAEYLLWILFWVFIWIGKCFSASIDMIMTLLFFL